MRLIVYHGSNKIIDNPAQNEVDELMDEQLMACRHLAQFFQLAVEYNMDEIDFTLKALNSEYKQGIERFRP